MSKRQDGKLRAWLVEPLADDVAESLARLAAHDDVVRVAVMPDVHLAREVCVGAIVATSHTLLPAAVGGDIGCGMAALRLDADADLLADDRAAASVLAELYRRVPCNRHRTETAPAALPAELAALPLSDARLEKLALRDGRVQLGTLGRGNHFLELQADHAGALWAMVHSGSRAMGQAITQWHCERSPTASAGLVVLDALAPPGEAYLADMRWALDYARLSRRAMLVAVEELLAARFGVSVDWSTYLDCHHNHVRIEQHGGRPLFVHRKGAQSALLDEPGLLRGSMGTASFHVAGRGCAESLFSCAHGAGRRLSRADAARSISARELERSLRHVWFDHRRAAALREEAPAAYKDVHAVMRAQRDLVRVTKELTPVLSYKGV